jgi:hypothetical protein
MPVNNPIVANTAIHKTANSNETKTVNIAGTTITKRKAPTINSKVKPFRQQTR